MYAEKIDVNAVIMSEVYCKKWMKEWEILFTKVNEPLDRLRSKKSEVGEFYLKIAKRMDITPNILGDISKEQQGLMSIVEKIKNEYYKA